jgi:hypothetical protein
MKIILDESVPQKLRLLIEGGHTVVTTWFQVWSGFDRIRLRLTHIDTQCPGKRSVERVSTQHAESVRHECTQLPRNKGETKTERC